MVPAAEGCQPRRAYYLWRIRRELWSFPPASMPFDEVTVEPRPEGRVRELFGRNSSQN